jgi:hypothetical protein
MVVMQRGPTICLFCSLNSMYRFWSSIIEPVCTAADVHTVTEIGIGQGYMTRLLCAYVKNVGGHVHAIDPEPETDTIVLCAEGGDALTVHPLPSLDVLPTIRSDLVLIDGDHNWHTVINELRTVGRWSPFPIVLLHDTGWPYGRRDMYYRREAIPPEYAHPTARCGMIPGYTTLVPGEGLNVDLANAIEEGGERNGVLTAIEDFLKEQEGVWLWQCLPGLHGLGMLIPRTLLERCPALATLMFQLELNPVLQAYMKTVESDRARQLVQHARLQKKLEQANGALERAHAQWRSLMDSSTRQKLGLEQLQDEVHLRRHEAQQLQTYIDDHERQWFQTTRELQRLQQTRSVRMTAPLRRLCGSLRRCKKH